MAQEDKKIKKDFRNIPGVPSGDDKNRDEKDQNLVFIGFMQLLQLF